MRHYALLLAMPLVLGAQASTPVASPTPEQLISERRFDEAKTSIAALISKDKGDPRALYLMGRLEYAQGNSSGAVDWFEKAVKRNDTSSVYHFWLGNALGDEAQKASKLRQPFLARRVRGEFERAVALDPTSIDAREGLVGFYSIAPGIMGGSMDKAREQATEILKLNPLRGHLQLGRIADRAKDLATAENEYKAGIVAAPDSTLGYNGLLNFYIRQARWEEAFETIDLLIKAKPDEKGAHRAYGVVAVLSGTQLERGEKELQYWIANAPKDATPQGHSIAHWRLGQIYEKTNRRDLAKAEYAEAVKHNPQNRDAQRALDALK